MSGNRNSAQRVDYDIGGRRSGLRQMKNWASQIVIGIIVTVVGTVIANVVIKGFGGRKGFIGGGHYSGPARAGR
jgi:hypothetical protein